MSSHVKMYASRREYVLADNPSYEIFKEISLFRVEPTGNIQTKVFFLINRQLELDHYDRVRMAFIVNDGTWIMHSYSGWTIMKALQNSIWLGHFKWLISEGKPYTTSQLTRTPITRSDSVLDNLNMKHNRSRKGVDWVRDAIHRYRGVSPYTYLYGRAKALYVDLNRLMNQKGYLAKASSFYQVLPHHKVTPMGLSKRVQSLLRDLRKLQAYEPASPRMQSVFDGLDEALLAIRLSFGHSDEAQKRDLNRASGSLLMAYLQLRMLDVEALKAL